LATVNQELAHYANDAYMCSCVSGDAVRVSCSPEASAFAGRQRCPGKKPVSVAKVCRLRHSILERYTLAVLHLHDGDTVFVW